MTNCIYCNQISHQLTDEHIIPLGLGGKEILRAASCNNCNVVTSKFEYYILRGHWLGIRKKLNTGSRHKKKPLLPMNVNLIQLNLVKLQGTVAVEDCNFQLVFFLYKPEILAGEVPFGIKPFAKEIRVNFIADITPKYIILSNGTKRNFLPGESIEYLIHEFSAQNFLRFLAKIAHSYAIKIRGWQGCSSYYLQDIILGDSSNSMRYIGAAPDSLQGSRLDKIDEFHSLQILESNGYVTVLIQLFNIEVHDVQPIYQVVVGTI